MPISTAGPSSSPAILAFLKMRSKISSQFFRRRAGNPMATPCSRTRRPFD
jgi:hypothetical protein